MSRLWAAVIGGAILIGCRGTTATAEKAREAAAIISTTVKEADLSSIRLTPAAERRLGIETEAAVARSRQRTRTWAGEAVLPPGQALNVSAPAAGVWLSRRRRLSRRVPRPGAASRS